MNYKDSTKLPFHSVWLKAAMQLELQILNILKTD